MTIQSINIELTDKPAIHALKHIPVTLLLLAVTLFSAPVQAIQVLSEDEMRNSSELLAVDNTGGIQTNQLSYLQRENEQSNSNGQAPQTPSLLSVSSQQTVIQDARRAADARNVDIMQQRWIEYRKGMLIKDPNVLWIRDLGQ